VIEILSPTTKRRDQTLKRELYERAGVTEYWLVDPARDVVDVYRRETGDRVGKPGEYAETAILTSSLLPNLEIALDRVFT
jgi:Uma2 family endonuclease